MSTIKNVIEPRLRYNYAKIRTDSGLCVACATFSYEINNAAYVLVPSDSGDYVGKYYHEGHWYADAEFTVPCPELDW